MSPDHREIFDCERVHAYLDSYLEGQVPPPEARAMRLHIHACPACHRRVLERDPLQLFAPLADEDRGDPFWTGFWPAVRADIHAVEAEARSWRARLLRPAIAWGTAAAMLLLAVVALIRPWGPPRPVAPRPVQAEMGQAWLAPIDRGPAGEPALPTVEHVRSPSARVLSMKVYGENQAVTEVVLIIDEEIEL